MDRKNVEIPDGIYEKHIDKITSTVKFENENLQSLFDTYARIIKMMIQNYDENIFKLKDDVTSLAYDYMLTILNVKVSNDDTRENIAMFNKVIEMAEVGCKLIEIDRLINNKPFSNIEPIVDEFNSEVAKIVEENPRLKDCIATYICRLLTSISESSLIFRLCFHESDDDESGDKDIESYRKIIDVMNSLGIIALNGDEKIFVTKTDITERFYVTYWANVYAEKYN